MQVSHPESRDEQARRMGYRAGNFSDGPKDRRDNPFDADKQPTAHAEWSRGFDDGRYGEPS